MAQSTHSIPSVNFWPQPAIACSCGSTLNNPAIYYDSNEVAVEILYRCTFCRGVTIKDPGANYVERFKPFE
jgi:hypothetical protein